MKRQVNKYLSNIIEAVIYIYFICVTLLHVFGSSDSIFTSVTYFSINNGLGIFLSMLLISKGVVISTAAKHALLFYAAYLTVFALFFMVVGIYAKDIIEYKQITSSIIGAFFYVGVLSVIALIKTISYGLRKSR